MSLTIAIDTSFLSSGCSEEHHALEQLVQHWKNLSTSLVVTNLDKPSHRIYPQSWELPFEAEEHKEHHWSVIYCPFGRVPSRVPTHIPVVSSILEHPTSFIQHWDQDVYEQPSLAASQNLKVASRVISPSKFLRSAYHKHLNLDIKKTHVVFHGIEAIYFQTQNLTDQRCLDFIEDRPFLLCGNLQDPWINLEVFLEAFSLLLNYQQDERAIILAKAPSKPSFFTSWMHEESELYKYSHKLADSILWVDPKSLSPQDLAGLFQSAKLFVDPAKEQSFGATVLQAIASQTPCLLAHSGAYPEIAKGVARWFHPEDPIHLAQTLSEQDKLFDPTNFQEKANAFQWEECAEKYLKTFEEAAQNHEF